MVLLGVAPCTAMVFVGSHLTAGDANYTLVQVSVNDLVMVFAFAPARGCFWVSPISRWPWSTLLASVLLFVVVPLTAGVLTWRTLLLKSCASGQRADRRAVVRQFCRLAK